MKFSPILMDGSACMAAALLVTHPNERFQRPPPKGTLAATIRFVWRTVRMFCRAQAGRRIRRCCLHKRRKIRAGFQDHTEAQKKTAPWHQIRSPGMIGKMF
ncbi:hypothetical protein [Rhodanobacter umsongensis]